MVALRLPRNNELIEQRTNYAGIHMTPAAVRPVPVCIIPWETRWRFRDIFNL